MRRIAAERGDFWLFGLFMRTETLGMWDLVVAASWLEAGQLKAVSEFVKLLSDRIGEESLREFARVATLPQDSEFLDFITRSMPNVNSEQRLRSTDLLARGIEEAIILQTRPVYTAQQALTDRLRFVSVWKRIVSQAGEEFRTTKGLPFTYTVAHGAVRPSRTNRNLSRADFEKALARVPLKNTAAVQDLQGPAFIYAIMMDERIRAGEW